ncbi:alpha/beta-hydrolase [Anaeromyces robustus]|uniref:Alpha/beta-hydrolase n=1 Tax=Anaeromyces robustus TaxID=1754192 RepID=A0A1Y1X901_9FUNG|nr:alpha/beta-hydrolase [Anaeromyces robustus]|eukprot:ORX82199.1 alpha/beta-hydrolase [Anaeromyces robustus]
MNNNGDLPGINNRNSQKLVHSRGNKIRVEKENGNSNHYVKILSENNIHEMLQKEKREEELEVEKKEEEEEEEEKDEKLKREKEEKEEKEEKVIYGPEARLHKDIIFRRVIKFLLLLWLTSGIFLISIIVAYHKKNQKKDEMDKNFLISLLSQSFYILLYITKDILFLYYIHKLKKITDTITYNTHIHILYFIVTISSIFFLVLIFIFTSNKYISWSYIFITYTDFKFYTDPRYTWKSKVTRKPKNVPTSSIPAPNSSLIPPFICQQSFNGLSINEIVILAKASYAYNINDAVLTWKYERPPYDVNCRCADYEIKTYQQNTNTIQFKSKCDCSTTPSNWSNYTTININKQNYIHSSTCSCSHMIINTNYTSSYNNVNETILINELGNNFNCMGYNIKAENDDPMDDAFQCSIKSNKSLNKKKMTKNNCQCFFNSYLEVGEYSIKNTTGVQYIDFIFPEKEMIVISIRGTRSIEDIFQNIYLWFATSLLQLSSSFNMILRFWPRKSIANIINAISKIVNIIDKQFTVEDDIPYSETMLDHVQNLKNSNPKMKLYLTGHSLGGGIAGIIASTLGIPSIAFSSPGLGYSYKSYNITLENLSQYFLNIIPNKDPVPCIDSQIGQIQNIMCYKENFVECHLLNTTKHTLNSMCNIEPINDFLSGK